eukprot:3813469-Prymnesium_polylepis.1
MATSVPLTREAALPRDVICAGLSWKGQVTFELMSASNGESPLHAVTGPVPGGEIDARDETDGESEADAVQLGPHRAPYQRWVVGREPKRDAHDRRHQRRQQHRRDDAHGRVCDQPNGRDHRRGAHHGEVVERELAAAVDGHEYFVNRPPRPRRQHLCEGTVAPLLERRANWRYTREDLTDGDAQGFLGAYASVLRKMREHARHVLILREELDPL